jgi:tRNA isopentenyl-2-thiomethyl-A-37 hydroxylase MiaE
MIEAKLSVLKCCQKIFRMKNSLFYRDLMESEAGHYTTFITYARKYGTGIDVEKTAGENGSILKLHNRKLR